MCLIVDGSFMCELERGSFVTIFVLSIHPDIFVNTHKIRPATIITGMATVSSCLNKSHRDGSCQFGTAWRGWENSQILEATKSNNFHAHVKGQVIEIIRDS